MADMPIRGKADIGQIAHSNVAAPTTDNTSAQAPHSSDVGKGTELNGIQKQKSRAQEGAMLTGKQEHCEWKTYEA